MTSTRSAGRLEHGELDELSGLVASRRQPGVLWVHNDSGDRPRIFAIDVRGRLLATVRLEAARAEDYEDIAIAPGPPDAADYLYIADTGDNLLRRETVQVYRVDEPLLGSGAPGAALQRTARMLDVSYEDGPHDVETLLVDPRSGDLFLVEKGPLLARREPVGVYRVSAEEAEHSHATARRVATVALGPSTAGDVLADGSGLAIRNYSHALFWPRRPSESIAQALLRAGCALPLAERGEQGESFGFAADGTSFFTIPEGSSATVHQSFFAR